MERKTKTAGSRRKKGRGKKRGAPWTTTVDAETVAPSPLGEGRLEEMDRGVVKGSRRKSAHAGRKKSRATAGKGFVVKDVNGERAKISQRFGKEEKKISLVQV